MFFLTKHSRGIENISKTVHAHTRKNKLSTCTDLQQIVIKKPYAMPFTHTIEAVEIMKKKKYIYMNNTYTYRYYVTLIDRFDRTAKKKWAEICVYQQKMNENIIVSY